MQASDRPLPAGLRFSALRLRNVRGFGEDGLRLEDLKPGLNVLIRPNEFGKSTIFDAIKASLFLPARSKGREAVSLVPDGAATIPAIDLEFETDQGSFRLQKRFAQGKKATMTQLVALAGGEVLLEAEAEGKLSELLGASGPAEGRPGLFWLAQGTAADAGLDPDQAATAASLLGDEVADTAGGTAVRTMIDKAQASLGELENKNGKPRAALKALYDSWEATAADIDEVREALRQTEGLTQKVLELRRRRATLNNPDDIEALRRDLEEAEKAVGEAEKAAHGAGMATQLVSKAEDELKALGQQYRENEDEMSGLKTLQKSVGMAAEMIADLTRRHGMTEARSKEKHAIVAKAREEREKAERIVEALQAKEQRLKQKEYVGFAKERLNRAKELLKALEIAQQEAGKPRIDLEPLQLAEEERLAAEAKRVAAAPSVVLEEEGATKSSLDGARLAPGVLVPVLGEGIVQVGDTKLRIMVHGQEEARVALEQAEARLQHLLREAGAENLADARAQAASRAEAVRERQRLERTLKEEAPKGVSHLEAELAALEGALQDDPVDALAGELPDAADLPEARDRLDDAKAKAAIAEAEQSAVLDQLRKLEDELAQARLEEAALKPELDRLSAKWGDEEAAISAMAALQEKIEDKRDEVGRIRGQLDDANAAKADLSKAERTRDRLREVKEKQDRDAQSIANDLVQAEAERSARIGEGDEARLAELQEKHASDQRNIDRLERRRAGLRKLLDTLREAQSARRARFQAPVLREMAPMLEALYGTSEIRFDDEYTLSALERPVGAFGFDVLSRGTQEQLALLTRLAFAKLAARQGQPAPVILDDALVFADDARLEALFDIIRQVADVTQVIVFSCHERLFDRLGGHALEPKPWPENASS